MIKFKFLIVLAMCVVFMACGSEDDGTRYIYDIDLVSKVDQDAGLYPGMYKISLKDKDASYDYFYTNESYTIGDSLTFVLISHLAELERAKAELEIAEAKIASQDSTINIFTNVMDKIKVLIAEVEKE